MVVVMKNPKIKGEAVTDDGVPFSSSGQ